MVWQIVSLEGRMRFVDRRYFTLCYLAVTHFYFKLLFIHFSFGDDKLQQLINGEKEIFMARSDTPFFLKMPLTLIFLGYHSKNLKALQTMSIKNMDLWFLLLVSNIPI